MNNFFTKFSNNFFKKGLNIKEIGLLLYIISKPPNREFSSIRMAKELNCGQDTILATIQNLVKKGIIMIKKYNNGKISYICPDRENPGQGKSLTGKIPILNNNNSIKKTYTLINNDVVYYSSWLDFLEYRKIIGCPLLGGSQKRILMKLSEFDPIIAKKIIEKSLDNGWKHLRFPQKKTEKNYNETEKKPEFDEDQKIKIKERFEKLRREKLGI